MGRAKTKPPVQGTAQSGSTPEPVDEWERQYIEQERVRLALRYESHLAEVAFYVAWRKDNPELKWDPRLHDQGDLRPGL